MRASININKILLLVLGMCCAACQPTSRTKPAEVVYGSQISEPSPSSQSSLPETERVSDNKVSSPEHPIRVGLLAPLSGPQGHEGHHMLNAAIMGVQDWQRSIQLYPADTCGTPEGTLTAYRSLRQRGVTVILGPLFSKELKALSQEQNLPMVISFSNDIQENPPQPIMRLGAFMHDHVQALFNYSEKKGLKKYALLVPSSSYGQKIEAFILHEIKTRQGLCPTIVRYDYAKMDPTVFNTLSSAAVDAWIVTETGARFDALMDQLAPLKTTPPVLLSVGLWSEDTIRKARVSKTWVALPSSEKHIAFQKRYHTLFHEIPSSIAPFVYDSVSLIALFSKEGLTQAQLCQAQGFEGTQATFRFVDRRSQRLLGVFTKTGQELTLTEPPQQRF